MIESSLSESAVDGIVEALRLQSQALNAGTKLPTVRALMKQFGVGQGIVQRAVAELEREGLLSAEVGRGTFVRRHAVQASAGSGWSVVILNHETPGRRGEQIAARLHEQLVAGGHRSVLVTYSDLAHAAELVQSLPPADACVVRPLGDVIPVETLATLRRKCRVVVVEGYPVEHVDIDSVATDWLLALETAVRRLRSLGHQRIALALSGRHARHAREGQRLFKSLMRLNGIDDAPVIFTVDDNFAAGMGDCSAVIAWGAAVVKQVRAADVKQSILVLENPDLDDPALAGLTIVGRPSSRIATAVLERIDFRLNNPAAPFVPVYDKPKLVVP